MVITACETWSVAELAGAAYVFERGPEAWRQVAELVPAHADAFSRACSSVAVEGDLLACGSPRIALEPGQNESGTLTVFMRDRGGPKAWGQLTAIGWQGEVGELFGAAVAFGNGRLWVGVPGGDDVGEGSGAVFPFEIEGRYPQSQGPFLQ